MSLRRLGMGLGLAAGLLGLAELGLRLAVPASALRFSWESEDALLVLEGDALDLAPHRDELRHDGRHAWRVRTNGAGLREDGERGAARAPGEVRLLALGDSWMFGHNADQGQTLPDQLEALLPARAGWRSVEVLNGGVFGACAFDMLRRWRQLSAAYELDGLVLGLPHNETRQLALAERRAGWYAELRAAPRLDLYLYLALRRALAPLTRPQVSRFAPDPSGAGVPDLVTLVEDARAMGLEVWFVGWPTDRRQPLEARARALDRWVTALGPAGVRATGHLLPQRACWGYEDPHHPSEAGYRALAEVLVDLIVGEGPEGVMREDPSCLAVPGDGPGK